jgi:glucokinase
MALYIGLDIGGTKLLAARADEEGRIVRRMQAQTPLDLQEGLDVLQQMVEELSEGRKIDGMGAAVGGPLDWRTGVVSPLHQPQWREVPLKALMEERWGCPFWVDVDTNIAALGEYYFGGETCAHLLYITLSTGMGGGFLVDGKIYRGMDGGHPEIGHMSVPYRCSNPDGLGCECGAPDCLEALVSGNAIRRIYGKPAERLSEAEWEEVTYNFGQGLRNLAVVLNPDVIAVGGGVAYGRGEKLIEGAGEILRAHLRLVAPPEVRLSRLGYETALMGTIAAAIYGII